MELGGLVNRGISVWAQKYHHHPGLRRDDGAIIRP